MYKSEKEIAHLIYLITTFLLFQFARGVVVLGLDQGIFEKEKDFLG